MSVEEKYFVGLEGIRLHFECKKCGTRISLTQEGWKFPFECLKCETSWFSRDQIVMGKEAPARLALQGMANAEKLFGDRDFILSFEVKK